MCYPGLDPSLVCETRPGPPALPVPDPSEDTASA
jgi:hypothetical protein